MTLLSFIAILSACGGGGGGGGATAAAPAAAPAPVATSTTFKLVTQWNALPAGTFAAASGTITLPVGVTVNTSGFTADVATGKYTITGTNIFTASGVALADGGSTITTYTPASGGTAGKLEFTFNSNNPAGIGIGEFLTMAINYLSNNVPTAGSFILSNFIAYDTHLAAINPGPNLIVQ